MPFAFKFLKIAFVVFFLVNPLTILGINFLGRRLSLSVTVGCTALFILLLNICTSRYLLSVCFKAIWFCAVVLKWGLLTRGLQWRLGASPCHQESRVQAACLTRTIKQAPGTCPSLLPPEQVHLQRSQDMGTSVGVFSSLAEIFRIFMQSFLENGDAGCLPNALHRCQDRDVDSIPVMGKFIALWVCDPRVGLIYNIYDLFCKLSVPFSKGGGRDVLILGGWAGMAHSRGTGLKDWVRLLLSDPTVRPAEEQPLPRDLVFRDVCWHL